MKLIDFFIKISLQGSNAVKQLRAIVGEADKAKKALNSVGAAAAKTNKQVKKNATDTTQSLSRMARAMRVGGGMRIGGAGATGMNIAVGPFLSALSAAPGPLKLLAVAAVAAAVSLRSLSKIQDAEAANVIAIDPRNADGTKRTPAEIAKIRRQQRELAWDGPELMVNGRNVLRNRSMLENTQDIGAMERAGVKATPKALASFARFSMLGEGVSDDDKAKAAAVASKEAKRRAKEATGGATSGAQFEKFAEQFFNEELGKVIKYAGDTNRSVSEAIRAQPKAQALIEEAGLSSSEAFAIQVMNSSVEPTARAASQHINSMLVDMLAGANKKKVKALAEEGTVLFGNDGKFLGLTNFVNEMKELEANGGSMAEAIKSAFGEENVGPMMNFIRNFDKFAATTKSFDQDPTLAADNAAAAQADTMSGATAGISASFERLMVAVGNVGFDLIFGFLADTLIFLMDTLATFINIIGQVTRPLTEVVLGIINTVLSAVKALVGLVWDALPKGVQETLTKISRPSEGLAPQNRTDNKKPGAPVTTAAVQAGRVEVAAASKEATVVAEQQTSVVETAKSIAGLATDATSRAQVFMPLMLAARNFQVVMVNYTKAARLGVYAELLRMLADVSGMAGQMQLAGASLGMSFNAGLTEGFGMPGAVPAGGTTNVTINNRGNGDAYLARQSKKQATNILGGQTSRSNLGR